MKLLASLKLSTIGGHKSSTTPYLIRFGSSYKVFFFGPSRKKEIIEFSTISPFLKIIFGSSSKRMFKKI